MGERMGSKGGDYENRGAAEGDCGDHEQAAHCLHGGGSARSDKAGAILCFVRWGRSLIGLSMLAFVAGCGASPQHASVSIPRWTVAAPQLPALPPAPTVKPVAYFVKKQAKAKAAVLKAPAAVDPTEATSSDGIAAGAPSDAEVARELQAAYGGKALAGSAKSLVDRAGLSGGLATTPPTAPPKVAAVIAAANQVASYPYVYGGGHGTFEDNAYDCSGSLSFAFAAAGMLHTTLVSGEFAHWGAPGPGKWITIYANATHTWMTVAGLRYDTGGLLTKTHSRWQDSMRPTAGFTVRHPIGL